MKLAIEGHSTQGSEVIALLKMLGGINAFNLNGSETNYYYYIDVNNKIYRCLGINPQNYIAYTLEEFLEKFPYKVGDKVQHKGATSCGSIFEVEEMRWEENTIKYTLCLFGCNYKRSTLPAEYLQPYKEETIEDKPNLLEQLKEYFENTPREVVEKEWHEYDKYNEIGPSVEEYLEYVSNIRQPQYPKTYEECAEILLERASVRNDIGYKGDLLVNLQRLLICRDAYWKIAGDWKPDFLNPTKEIRYFLFCTGTTIENGQGLFPTNKILIFPTEEMRNKFYENFEEEMEMCKELL